MIGLRRSVPLLAVCGLLVAVTVAAALSAPHISAELAGEPVTARSIRLLEEI